MSKEKNPGKLTKGDVISFVALLLMGVLVFFGMNFMTLGDKIPSIMVAIITVILMTVFVFLAAFAKAQNRNQSTWKKVQYSMLFLYVVALIPCYFFVAKFFDVQFEKDRVLEQVEKDTDGLNDLFGSYSRQCEARVSEYRIMLEAMVKSKEGRTQLASLLDIENPDNVTMESVNQAVEVFSKSLKGAQYKNLEASKNKLVKNSRNNFSNWNLMYIPRYAYELGTAQAKYAEDLKRIYDKTQNDIEQNVPEFDIESYSEDSEVLSTFRATDRFSIVGLLVVIFLGFLGLVKYLLGEGSTVKPLKQGEASVIEKTGGIQF